MNFLEYVKGNNEGLLFIDKLRNTIKKISHDEMKEEFIGATEEDIDKLSLMTEYNFFDGITSDDSEWDLNTITLEDVKFLVGSTIGFHKLCNAIEKNKRESYTEILYDVLYHLFSNVENVDELFKSSKIVKEVYEKVEMIESGEDEYHFGIFSDDELNQCITEIYKLMIKDKIEI
jgi:hypothetical protein